MTLIPILNTGPSIPLIHPIFRIGGAPAQCFYRLEQPHPRAMTADDIQYAGGVAYPDEPGVREEL